MHEYAGGNLALRRVVAEVNSARPDAPVVDGPAARRRRTAGPAPGRTRSAVRGPAVRRRAGVRVALAGALRGVAARLDPPCATPQAAGHAAGRARGGAV
ncbi:hypothetical protein [Promicromonospora sp. NPDC060271]|uniref:hypothetical protein n=1 Tax=Promicromonospora sp. NPDC060271 TaxID=3347089 RepID=UPI0036673A8D